MKTGVETKSRFDRLTSLDRMFLHLETEDWPGHFGALVIVEAGALQDDAGHLQFDEICERLNRRVSQLPRLRQRLHHPGPLCGGPMWVDDLSFDISYHVRETRVGPPGRNTELLDTAAQVYARLLDRNRPLWELWFLDGLADGRLGVLLKMHHSLADGMAAVAVIGALLDRPDDNPGSDPGEAAGIPAAWPIFTDGLRIKGSAAARALRVSVHPRLLIDGLRRWMSAAREALAGTAAPRTSLNQAVGSGRRIRFLSLDLAAVRVEAGLHGAKVNDVVLDLWSGGLRALMAERGEATTGVELITTIPVSLRARAGTDCAGNQVGFMMLPLPIGEPDSRRRLELIAGITRREKTRQRPSRTAGILAAASALPLGRLLTARQRSVNVRVSNLIGPPDEVSMMGARVIEILPVMRLFGNVGLALGAFSYAGRLALVVTADARSFPDLDVLIRGMEQEWLALTSRDTDSLLTAGAPAQREAPPVLGVPGG